MSKERPYEFVPTYALAVLISEYERIVEAGMFRYKDDLETMKAEMQLRFAKPEENKQISIKEYIKGRSKGK